MLCIGSISQFLILNYPSEKTPHPGIVDTVVKYRKFNQFNDDTAGITVPNEPLFIEEVTGQKCEIYFP